MSKISLFCGEEPSEIVKKSIEDLSNHQKVKQISVLPDVYQKEHTMWPSGITVVTEDMILPDIIYGVGCGISLFRLGPDISAKTIENIMDIIHTCVRDYEVLNTYFDRANIKATLLDFDGFLDGSGFNSITDSWRNDTQSDMRFGTLEECLVDEYIPCDITKRGSVIIEGNHFVELQRVEVVYDPEYMAIMSLSKGDVLLTLHFEDEGLNTQMEERFKRRYGLREISYPSSEAEEFITLTNIGQRYCFMNRVMIAKYIIDTIRKKRISTDTSFILDTTHTGLFKEETEYNTQIYHTSGTTIALPPNHDKMKERIRPFGQPLVLPGALGIESYLLRSSNGTLNSSLSVNHGLGRRVSKAYARSNYSEDQVKGTFKYPDLVIRKVSDWDLVSQMNNCYKNIDAVLEVMQYYDLALKVAKLEPLGTLKG